MKKQFVFALILAVAGFGASISAQEAAAAFNGGGSSIKAAPGSIGSTVANFTLPDAAGKNHSLASLSGKNGTVLVFVSVQCPIVQAYNERIVKLASDFQSQGINMIGINSNSTESPDQVKAHASKVSYNFPVLIDEGSKFADSLGANRTPETFLLNGDNKIVYHGRIDNSASLPTVTTSELRDAMTDVAAGRPVAKAETTAVGCTIKRKKSS